MKISSEADDMDAMGEMQTIAQDITGRRKAVDALENVMNELGRSVSEHTSLLKHATEQLLAELTRRKAEEEALMRRDAILEAVGIAAQLLLRTNDLESTVQIVLEQLGVATGVSRVALCEEEPDNVATQNNAYTPWYQYWIAPDSSATLSRGTAQETRQSHNNDMRDAGIPSIRHLPRWKVILRRGKPVYGKTSSFPSRERDALEAQAISSIAILPIMINQKWWGVVRFDNRSHEHTWSTAEIDSLKMVANILGAAIQRDSAQKDLDKQNKFFRNVIDSTTNLVFARDQQGRFTLVNQALADFYGISVDHLIGKTTLDTLPNAHELTPIHHNDLDVIRSRHEQVIPEQQITDASGKLHWLHIIKRPILRSDGTPGQVLGVAIDITSHKHTTQTLQQTCQQQRYWLRALGQRNRDITMINEMSDSLQRCLTISEAYDIITRYIIQVFPEQSGGLYILDTYHQHAEAVAIWGDIPRSHRVFAAGQCQALQNGEKHIVDKAGTPLHCNHVPNDHPFAYLCTPLVAHGETLGLLHLRHTLPLTASTRDRWDQLGLTIADHISLSLANLYLRKRLQEQSIRDALTGLFNRRYLEETLRRELCQAMRHDRKVGVIILDIDHFKQFNDIYGHRAGDTVLQELGLFLQRNIRGGDIACRYGGEEFVLILPEAPIDDTYKRAEELRKGIKDLRVIYQNQQLPLITLSLGIASFPEHGDHSEAVIRAADDALYSAKAKGRDCVMIARLVT